jgi:chromate transporter
MTKASGKADSVSHPSFAQAFRFWVKLGFISFGGPAGQSAIMPTGEQSFLGNSHTHGVNRPVAFQRPNALYKRSESGWD